MKIALDYDGTYTADPRLWFAFVKLAQTLGHTVLCVTMRSKEEARDMDPELIVEVSQLICTNRKAKKPFVEDLGINIDIWIDDNPEWILHDATK